MTRIGELRVKSGLTQQEMADLFFVNQTAVSQWERGVTTPSPEMLKRIALHFQVSIDYLLGYDHFLREKEPQSSDQLNPHFFLLNKHAQGRANDYIEDLFAVAANRLKPEASTLAEGAREILTSASSQAHQVNQNEK